MLVNTALLAESSLQMFSIVLKIISGIVDNSVIQSCQ